MASNCLTNGKGRLDTNKLSLLHSKLIKTFPDKRYKNSEQGSVFYDKLFSPEFVKFYGQWFPLENESQKDKAYWEQFYTQNPQLLDELGEPKLFQYNNESYFVNAKEERFYLNRKYLSNKDKLDIVNALSLVYQSKPNESIYQFTKSSLETRVNSLVNEIGRLEESIEDNPNMDEDSIIDIENQMFTLNEARTTIQRDILENEVILQNIVDGITVNLADYNYKYIDEADVKEDEDPNTNDEITNFTKESSEVRDTNNIDAEIKSILGSIIDYDIDINNNETPKQSKLLLMPLTRPANVVKNRIIENVSNIIELELLGQDYISDPYDLMINKLQERQTENDDLIIRDFLDKINIVYNSKSAMDKEAFKTKFVTSFYKAQNVFTITEITNDGSKLILRHIDPTSTQDKEAFIANEITRNIFNKFNYTSGNINNEELYNKASTKLRNFKTKNDIIDGLKMLDITLNPKTINKLFTQKENILQDITKSQTMALKDLFKGLFTNKINYRDTEELDNKKISSEGLKMILEAYSNSNVATQNNILKALTDKDEFTPISILSKFESVNKTDLSDSSLFVGNKQRWMYSLVSGLNKEILRWKSGNIRSLLNKKHKNLQYVDYLLDLDSVKAGRYTENSPENIEERNRRLSNLKLIINSELKNPNDANPIQHKEIGEADLHMDVFFKMFNDKDEIYQEIDKQVSVNKELKNRNQTRSIFSYIFSADKGGSYSIGGLPSINNEVILNSDDTLNNLGLNNKKIIQNYITGEFEGIKNHSKLIEGYLNAKTNKQKQAYLMQYLIPDYHYVTKLKVINPITEKEETIIFNAEDENQVLDFRLINAGTWNKFNFFNSSYNNNQEDFDILFTYRDGVKLANDQMRSQLEVLANSIEKDIIDIANQNKTYLDAIIIESGQGKNTSLFNKETNIIGSNTPQVQYQYIINSIFNNMEMFSLFNGELSMYKQKGNTITMEDALKRGPAILTDGLYIRQTNKAENTTYKNYNNQDIPVDKNKQAVTAVVNVLENDKSKFAEQIKKGTGNENLSYNHEIADAQGFISLDFYKKIISGTYGWTTYDNKIFNRLNDKNYKTTTEDIKWLKGAGRSMQALKLTGFNLETLYNDNQNIIGEMPVYLKYSTAVLAPSIIGGTDLELLSNQMSKQNVDQVLFKSGSKASNRQATEIYNKENGIFTGLKKDMRLNPFTFDIGGLKLQVELPTKFDKDGVLGNQHFKNLIANLDLTNNDKIYNFRDQKLSAQELFNEYDNTIKSILKYQLDDFGEKISLAENNNTYSFDQTKLRELLVKQLDINEDFDLIEILRDTSLPLESIPGIAQRAFPILSSYIHKNVGKVRTNAGSAIQVANIGFDRVSNEDSNNVIYLSEDKELRPPLPATVKDLTQEELNKLSNEAKKNLNAIVYFDENGNPSLERKYGKMRIQKARIMLPFTSIYEKTEMSYEDFKKELKLNRIDLKIFNNLIGYRIPNQSISSNDSIEIVGILPPNMGDTAIVYHEITAKTGSDFDIDKMYLMLPNFQVNKNDKGQVLNIKYIQDESNKGQQNKLIELMGSILSAEKTYDDLISPLDSDIPKDAINEVLYIKSILTDEDFESKYKSFTSLKDKSKSTFLKTFADQRKLNPLQQTAPVGMIRSRVDMLQAKKLVATMANHMTDIPMSQIVNQVIKYDLGINSTEFNKLFTSGQENNNEYKLTKIVSYLMNAAVDAAKDNYIIEGNFNSYTANGAMLMIRLGIDPVNVFKILLNDDVLKLSKLKQLQTAKISNISTDDYSQDKLNDYSKSLIVYMQTNKLNFNEFINKTENFNSNLILGFWNIIQLAGKELNNDIVSAKADSNGAGKNIYEHQVLYNRLEKLAKENIGSVINDNFSRGLKLFKNGIDLNRLDFTTDIENSDLTFLGAMMNNSLFLTNFITKNMFLENTDNYRYIVNRISNQLGEALPTNADNIKIISNYMYPYILSQSGHKLYNLNESEVNYLQKDFLKEVLNKKAGNPNNIFLRELYVDTSTNLISFPNYKYFGPNDKILLRESVEDLYKQVDLKNNPIGLEFINKLVKYAFLTTGFKPTFFSMNEYLPKSYFLNTGHGYYINKLLDRMNDSSEFKEDESIEKILTFIGINNENNYKIVANPYKLEGIVSGKAINNKLSVSRVTIKGSNNFYPFVKVKSTDSLYLLTGTELLLDKEKQEYKAPVYTEINSNSIEVNTEANQKIKRKTKVKLFDLNTIRTDNLFKESQNNNLFIQPEIQYISELSSVFENNNLSVQNDDVSLQQINNMQEETTSITQEQLDTINKAFAPQGFGGFTIEEFNALPKEEQDKIIECYG